MFNYHVSTVSFRPTVLIVYYELHPCHTHFNANQSRVVWTGNGIASCQRLVGQSVRVEIHTDHTKVTEPHNIWPTLLMRSGSEWRWHSRTTQASQGKHMCTNTHIHTHTQWILSPISITHYASECHSYIIIFTIINNRYQSRKCACKIRNELIVFFMYSIPTFLHDHKLPRRVSFPWE